MEQTHYFIWTVAAAAGQPSWLTASFVVREGGSTWVGWTSRQIAD